MSNIEHKDVGVSSLKGTPSRKIYIKTSTEAVYNPEGVTQEYINNHVDGSKIVDGTVTTGKIADNAVTMGKLDNVVQTEIQRGTQRAWTPKGNYSAETVYNVNDLVYYPDTNSSYISLQANNQGHNPAWQSATGGWWMKVVDGSYVNVVEEELQQLVDSISEGTQQQVEELNEALEALEAQADQSRQDIQDIVDSLAVVQTTGQSASDVMSQKAVSDIIDGRSTAFSVIGKGNTFATSTEYNKYIKVGSTYRLWVLNPDVSMEGISGLNTNAGRLSVSYYQSDDTLIEEQKFAYWQQSLADYYDFVIPDGCAYIVIGGRCAVGSEIKLVIEDITAILPFFTIRGVKAGVYRAVSGTQDVGYVSDPLYGLGSPILISKGDVVLWHYGNVGQNTMSLCVYNENERFVGFYRNERSNELFIPNFMQTGSLTRYIVRASLLLANDKDNYIEVNGIRVWTASITEDLGTQCHDLKNSLPYSDIDLHNLYIDSEIGAAGFSSKRLSTSFIALSENVSISVAEGFKIRTIAYYTKEKVFISADYLNYNNSADVEWQEGMGYIKVVINYSNDATDISVNAPIELSIKGSSAVDAKQLQKATFNSSYNEIGVEAIRKKYCGLLNGKNIIENFLLFSDPHLSVNSRYESITESVRDSYISTMQKYYNSLPLDNCICAGDLLNYHNTNAEGLDELGYFDSYMRKLFRNYRPCMGNHDTAPYNAAHNYRSTTLVHNDVRNALFREEKNTYYSFDGTNTKFYVLNSGSSYIKTMTSNEEPTINNIRWTQVDWYANKLLEDDASYSIIIMHMYSNGTPLTWYTESTAKASAGIFPFSRHIREVAIAYNKRTSITKNGITYDFSSCEGKVMAFICGHSHFDFIDDSMELPVVCITDLEGGVWDAAKADVTYALIPTFDCCMMDISNSVLYMTRVGAGASRIINCECKTVSAGGNISLTCKLAGTITWQTRQSSIATVSDGTVTGVTSGCTGIIATNGNSEEEYWIVKVV